MGPGGRFSNIPTTPSPIVSGYFKRHPTLRQLFLTAILFSCVSCGHTYENSRELKAEFKKRESQKSDTIIAVHEECTECLDLVTIQGSLTIPKDLKGQFSRDTNYDFRVCGNFPFDLTDNSSFVDNTNLSFRIIGKVIKVDTNNGNGKVPLFYVDQWEKFYFRQNEWSEKGDLNSYPKRPKIIQGVLDNLKFEGQTLSTIHRLLGQPDLKSENKISYKIEEKYGSDIDPIYSKYLDITFDKDSIINGKTITEWKKNSR